VPLRSIVVYRLSSAKRIILVGHGPGVVGISELLESRSEYSNYFQLAHAVKLSSCWCDALCETCGSSCWLYKDPACPQERSRLEYLVPEGTDMHVYPMSSNPHLTQCQHSLVIVPHDHIIRHEGKILKRHGQLVFAGEYPLAFLWHPTILHLPQRSQNL
jgi:hypothetical protein